MKRNAAAPEIRSLPPEGGTTKEQFDKMMETGLRQAQEGRGTPLETAFARIRAKI